MAWRTLMTPIFDPVAEPGAEACACSALAPKIPAAAKIANFHVFRNDPAQVRVKILEFTFFSFFLIAQNLSQTTPA
jgi:hypothetical protein